MGCASASMIRWMVMSAATTYLLSPILGYTNKATGVGFVIGWIMGILNEILIELKQINDKTKN